MKILHHVQSLDQSQGGLAVAVADLCSTLVDDELCDVVLTVCGNLENAVPLSDKVGPITIPVSNALMSHFLPAESFQSDEVLDCVHQHGLWTRSMRIMADFAKQSELPLIISPHGMLEPWALSQRSLRKQIAWRLYQRNILEQATAFHATSEMEAAHIRKLGFSQPIAVIPNGAPKGWNPSFSGGAEERTVVFLSRLHQKKGLNLLVEAWAKTSPINWKLKVFGDGDDSYRKKISALIARHRLGDEIKLMGPVYNESKWKALGEAELFVLPSFSENFGIVVAEALSAGTPVITTARTPWKLIEDAGCGWCVEPTVEALSVALADALSKSETDLQKMGEAGARLIDEQFRWELNAKRMADFYRWISAKGERPSFVKD